MSYPYFAFIDESGTLAKDPNQPIFAIGLLLIDDTSRLLQELQNIKSQAIAGTGSKAKLFEFKFKGITKGNYMYYQQMIDVALSFPQLRICVFIMDKRNPKIQISTHFNSTWDAYLSYTKLVIRKNVTSDRKVIVLADYITKPSDNPKFFEPEIRSLQQVENVTLLESDSSLFIQLIDILTGSVVYKFRHRSSKGLLINESKMKVANYLMNKLRRSELADNFTVQSPVYFSVWEFNP
jgi:hypothetical protein